MLHRKLEEILNSSLARRDGSRLSMFTADEKQKLRPLSRNKFETFEEKVAVVARDYHIQYDSAFYSVPSKYIRDKVRVRATALSYAGNSIPEAVERTCEELLRSGITSSKGFRIFLHRYSRIEASQLVQQTDANDLFCSHEEVVH